MSETHGHEKDKNSSIFKITLNLTVTCLISGLIIAGAYYLTHPIAEEKAAELKIQSMKALVPDAAETKEVSGEEGMMAAMGADGKEIAYIVEVEPKGYGGAIHMLVAVTPDGKVYNFKIVSANETPGLGTKASESPFKDQFSGLTVDELKLSKDSADGKVQAMTGATITSRAVTKGIAEAVQEVDDYLKGGAAQ